MSSSVHGVPGDIKSLAHGRRVTLWFPDERSEETIVVGAKFRRDDVGFSLRTRDPATAKKRIGLAIAQLDQFYASLRNGPRPLTKKQIVGLAGQVYRGFADGAEDDPGPAAVWAEVQNANQAANRGRYGNAGLMIAAEDSERRRTSMEARFGRMADSLLAAQGIITDAASRWALIEELERSTSQAARKLQRNAEGDYRPDPDAHRFPEWKRDVTGASHRRGARTIGEIFEGWRLEATAAGLTQKTIKEYQSVITRFIDLLGHDDAQLVSPADVVRWKDKRLADGRAAKTVKDVDLSALKSVFGWAERKEAPATAQGFH